MNLLLQNRFIILTLIAVFLSGSAYGLPPLATTGNASQPTATGARLHATVDDNGQNTAVRFRVHSNSTSVTNGSAGFLLAGESVPPGSGETEITGTVSTFLGGTRYYYRVEASHDNFATYSSGSVLSFITLPYPPGVYEAGSVTSSGFTIRWIASNSSLVDGYRLDVAIDEAFTNKLSGYDNLQIVGRTTVNAQLTGLNPGTQYWYRVRAENTSGYSTYSTGSQTTPIFRVTAIGRAGASPTNATSATFNVTFNTDITSLNSNAFSLIATGTASGTIGTPAGSGSSWAVPVTDISGDGVLRLNLTNKTGMVPNADETFTSGETYFIDNTPPSAPSRPALQAADDTGVSNSDQVTSKTSITLTGTAEANSTVTLYGTDGMTVLGTTTASGAGSYSVSNSAPLSEGQHQLTVKASDAAGNQGQASAVRAVTIDTTAPTLSLVNITSNHTNPALAKTGDVVSLNFTSSESIKAPSVTIYGQTVLATGSGTNWTVSLTIAAEYPDGTIDFSIPLEDIAGNTGLNVTETTDNSSVKINRNANLSAIALSTGSLTPSFSPGITSYNASVGNIFATITVRPTSENAGASIQVRVNGGGYSTVNSGAASSLLALNFGDNTIDVRVTAEDGVTVKTYTLTVNRKSADASLAALALSSGSLSPAFSRLTESYTASVSNSTTSVTITPTANQANATIAVQVNNGGYAAVNSGSASAPLGLNVGDNTIEVKVTAQNLTTFQIYDITVTRPSTDATLSALALSSGTLSPAFVSGTESYTASVANATSSITLTPAANQANATIEVQVNGAGYDTVSNGSASAPLALNAGNNSIEVRVTAQDGTTVKTYTLTVNRISSDATLSALSLSNGTLSPAFVSGTESYTASVANATSSITLTPTANQANATIEVQVNGAGYASVNSGSASSSFALNLGNNSIEVRITAQDGTTVKSYTISVNRLSSDANLSALSLSSGTLSPAFVSGTESYTASVTNATSSITITPTATQANAAIEVQVNSAGYTSVNSGSASAPLTLNVGSNGIEIRVTAQDGTTVENYIITVNRAAALSAVAGLSGLKLSSGELSPAFAVNTTAYTATLPYTSSTVRLTPTVEQVNATVKVNGTPVNSGTASGDISLTVGQNVINVEVTAEDGITIKDYMISLNRSAASALASLNSLTLNEGVWDKVFQASMSSYEIYVDNKVSSLVLTASAEHSSATIKVNSTTMQGQPASAGLNLAVGLNTIPITVTAEDGTTSKTYTLNVTRLPAGQTVPDQTGMVTAGEAITAVLVTSPTQPLNLTIPQGTTTPTSIDYSKIVSAGSGTVPQTIVTSPLAKVEIPASTTVQGTNTVWNGTIMAPQISDYDFPKVKGQNVTKGLVIEVGDPNVSLTFSKAVRLVLYGQAGMRVARVHNKVYEEITATGAADSQTEADKLAPAAAFKINSGADMVVWTKGFSQFITFQQSVNLDEAIVLADLAALTPDKFIAMGESAEAISAPLSLPASGTNGSSISWSSSHPAVISSDGLTVRRSAFGSGDITITLTALLRRGAATETAVFTLTVPELPNSAPTLDAINNQTVCPTTSLQNISLSGISAGAENDQITQLFVSTDNSSLFSSLAVAGGTGSSGLVSYILNPGANGTATITVTVRDNGGTAKGGINSVNRSFSLTVAASPAVSISSSRGAEIDKGASVVLTASGGSTYAWSNAEGILSGQNTASLTVRPAVTTTYTVTASNSTGCTATQSFTVQVKDNFNAIEANNILSPNGDGRNDKLVFKNLDLFPNHTLRIFDKAGRVLYKKGDYSNDWEGTFEGLPLTQDTYYYILDFGPKTGKKRGYISIVR